jgi:hypothetical protein
MDYESQIVYWQAKILISIQAFASTISLKKLSKRSEAFGVVWFQEQAFQKVTFVVLRISLRKPQS